MTFRSDGGIPLRSALFTDLDLPVRCKNLAFRRAPLPALAWFNVGVEIGQIAIVAAVIPMLMAFDRLAGSVRGSHAAGRTPVAV